MAATLMAQATGQSSDSGSSSSYDGPNVMGRGELRIGLSGAESVPIRVSFNVSGTYDTLLGAFRTDGDGNLASGAGSYGVQGGFAVSGQKKFRRAVLGLSYSGDYNYFTSVQGFNGFNQALNLGYTRRLSRNLEMSWVNTASMTNRLLGNPLNQQSLGADVVAAPVNEIFDNRIYFAQSQLLLNYRLNSRWQLQGGGTGGTVRRNATSLADVNIYGGNAALIYRLDRNTTVGFGYNFSHFNFGRFFGESNLHGVSFNVGRKIGRDWQITASVTGQAVRIIGIRRVILDPVIAALLGGTTGFEAFDSSKNISGYNFAVERRFRRSLFSVRADRSVVPGNGLLLTSVINSQLVGFSTSASRNWSVNAGASRMNMGEVVGSTLGAFNVWQAQAGINRTLTTEIGLFSSVEYRSFGLGRSTLDRRGTRYILGLTYSPTSLPFGR